MHIYLVTNLYPPDIHGGYELLARDVTLRLRGRGHRVDVITSGDGDEPGCLRRLRLVRPFGEPPRRDRLRYLRLGVHNRRAVERCLAELGRPDVVLGMSQRRLGLAPLAALARAGLPIVCTVNDDWPLSCSPRHGAGLRGRVGALLDAVLPAQPRLGALGLGQVIYLSDAIRTLVRHALPELPPGMILHQGIDLDRFAPPPAMPPDPPRPLGTPLRLLFSGRLHPIKAPDVAIDTLAVLVRAGIDATLTIAGMVDDPAYAATLRAQAEQAGVGPRIQWLGHVSREQMPDVYRAADVFLFLGRWEGEAQGLTWIEALACGVPVVAHPMGGAREVLDRHPVTARAAACTGEAMAEATRGLLHDAAARQRLVDDGLRFVAEHASLDAYVARIERELERAAATVTAGARARNEPAARPATRAGARAVR